MAASTHTVTNQVPPLVGYDVFGTDRALAEGVERHSAPGLLDATRAELTGLGRAMRLLRGTGVGQAGQ